MIIHGYTPSSLPPTSAANHPLPDVYLVLFLFVVHVVVIEAEADIDMIEYLFFLNWLRNQLMVRSIWFYRYVEERGI